MGSASTQHLPFDSGRARHTRLHDFLCNVNCVGAFAKGNPTLSEKNVDRLSGSLGGRGIQSDLGDAETDVVFLWIAGSSVWQLGSRAAFIEQACVIAGTTQDIRPAFVVVLKKSRIKRFSSLQG